MSYHGIRVHDKIDGTLVAGMYFRFKVEQMDKYPDIEQGGRMGYKPDWSAVAMYDKGVLLGAVVYHMPKDTNGLHICAAYMYPAYRNRGLYKDLWNALLKEAKMRGRLYIDSSTHRDNKEMVDLYEKQGRTKMGTFWLYPIGRENE